MIEENESWIGYEPLPTHKIDVELPMNTKYVSGNPLSRWLIRGFMEVLIRLVSYKRPLTILDVGCGEGLIVRQLEPLWDQAMIHGLDIDFDLLDAARQIAPSASYLSGSIYQLPLAERSYDLVICTEVLEHLEKPETALAEMARVSRGYCLLRVPHEPWWRLANMIRGSYLFDLGNTPGHLNHWNNRSFVEFVSRWLQIVDVRQPFPWTMVLARVERN